MCSDWLILGHNSPVMPTGQLQAYKTKAKSLNIFQCERLVAKLQHRHDAQGNLIHSNRALFVCISKLTLVSWIIIVFSV